MRVTATQIQARIRSVALRTRILKAAEAQRFAWGVAYPANRVDGHGEYMTPETVEAAAWSFLRDGGRQIGFQHADGTLGHGQVVESAIWRADPWTTTGIDGEPQTINPGDWVLGVVFDDPGWREIKAGKARGWSIDGLGKRKPIPRDQAPVT